MAVWCVTGKLGAGKTLVAVSRIELYLNQNRRICTNLDLNLEFLINPSSKHATVFRTKDVPDIDDFNNAGLGYDGDFQGDHKNGLMVFDECAKWLNTRDYRDPNRKQLIDWLIHARKKRWDVIFIIQDVNALDKQMRELFCEHVVYCRRMDKHKIMGLSLPRMHIGIVKYGTSERSPTVDKWIYRGSYLFDAYDTEQAFYSESKVNFFSYLPPFLTTGRYFNDQIKFTNRLNDFKEGFFLISGVAISAVFFAMGTPNPFEPNKSMFKCNDAYENLIGCDIHPIDLKALIDKHRFPENYETNDISEDKDPLLIAKEEFNNVRITASVLVGSTYEYYFVKNDVSYEPFDNGYRVYDINECKASLLNMDTNEVYYVTC